MYKSALKLLTLGIVIIGMASCDKKNPQPINTPAAAAATIKYQFAATLDDSYVEGTPDWGYKKDNYGITSLQVVGQLKYRNALYSVQLILNPLRGEQQHTNDGAGQMVSAIMVPAGQSATNDNAFYSPVTGNAASITITKIDEYYISGTFNPGTLYNKVGGAAGSPTDQVTIKDGKFTVKWYDKL